MPSNLRSKKLTIRVRLALKQNRAALLFIGAWLAANAVVFTKLLGVKVADAILLALCLTKASGGWASAYQAFTEVVVFGAILSLVVSNVTRKYRPEATCRALASEASGHVVVIGWNNLGKRIRELVTDGGAAVVVVEHRAEEVTDLVRDEEAVVVGSPADAATIEHAAVARAKVVVITTDDLEHAAVACRLVREVNAECELVVRCPDDDVSAVLARTYRARPLSTSKLAAAFVQGQALLHRAKKAVVLGRNNIGDRVAVALHAKQIAVAYRDVTEDAGELAASGVADADLVVICDDDLGKNLIRVDRIRDLNKRAKIVCRAFHEDAAEVLEREPFDCLVLSTSRHAADSLVRAGVFREVGAVAVPVSRAERRAKAASRQPHMVRSANA